MKRWILTLAAGLLAVVVSPVVRPGVSSPAAAMGLTIAGVLSVSADAPQPPIADPQQLVAAYYQMFAASVNSGDFTPLISFFTPDAAIDTSLVPGGASGSDQILAYFRKLPLMAGFSVETSNLVESDPYVDVDWRFRAAPGSMRGYLDGHDSFTIQEGLISQLSTQADVDAVAGAFMPPPAAPPATGMPVAKTKVRIENFKYAPQVIQVAVGATVSWTSFDADVHTVTTDDRTIDSGLIEQDVTVSLTFSVAGSYSYYCTTHPGMRGRVIVGGQ